MLENVLVREILVSDYIHMYMWLDQDLRVIAPQHQRHHYDQVLVLTLARNQLRGISQLRQELQAS